MQFVGGGELVAAPHQAFQQLHFILPGRVTMTGGGVRFSARIARSCGAPGITAISRPASLSGVSAGNAPTFRDELLRLAQRQGVAQLRITILRGYGGGEMHFLLAHHAHQGRVIGGGDIAQLDIQLLGEQLGQIAGEAIHRLAGGHGLLEQRIGG